MSNYLEEILVTGYIYKCYSKTDDKVYYGSCKNLDKRKSSHNNNNNRCMSAYIVGEKIFDIIELHRNISRRDLKKRERYFLETHNDPNYFVINKTTPLQTDKEYQTKKYKLKGAELKLKQKVYYYKNHEKEKERLKKYYEKKKGDMWVCPDCNKSMNWYNKSNHLKSCTKPSSNITTNSTSTTTSKGCISINTSSC